MISYLHLLLRGIDREESETDTNMVPTLMQMVRDHLLHREIDRRESNRHKHGTTQMQMQTLG